MAKDYSPFTPGVPVPLEFFVGRETEMKAVLEKAGAVSTGRLERAFIIGERGMGKSSFCKLVRVLGDKDFGLLGVHAHLGGTKNLHEMVRRILDKLLNDSIDRPWYSRLKEMFGHHIREVDIFGVKLEFSAKETDLDALVNNFAQTLGGILKQVGNGRKGLLLILDDLDELSRSADFAHWLKSFIDGIATGGKELPLLLVLVGLPSQRLQLVNSQPSLARIFDIIDIKPLTKEETKNFYIRAFEMVNVGIEEDALNMLCNYSGGHPALAQEIGDAVFKVDTDNTITKSDAAHGIINAAEVVGRKYIEPQVYEAIRSEKYKAILKKLTEDITSFNVRRRELLDKLGPGEEKALDNFLKKMTDLGVLVKDADHGRGAYKFAQELHFVYFWMRATKQG